MTVNNSSKSEIKQMSQQIESESESKSESESDSDSDSDSERHTLISGDTWKTAPTANAAPPSLTN